jgi:hypothetical protein
MPLLASITDLGAIQGLTGHDGKWYVYGDVHEADPRCGAIREYDADFRPTGRVVWLTKDGQPLALHPTGLTFAADGTVFLGDTVKGKGTIYHLDGQALWEGGTMDEAILQVIKDDAAVNGCRPEIVSLGKEYLATADYGDVTPAIRVMDIGAMLAAGRTGEEGVVVHRIACGPYTQNLHWDSALGRLTCVQNVTAGLGWQLDVLDLEKAIRAGDVEADGVRVWKIQLPHDDELEGYRPFGEGKGIFVTSMPKDNVWVEAMGW